MTITEIYEKFTIPPNLQEHMLTVAEVSRFIVDHWTGPELDSERVIKAALLHDLGNIVKFDFDKYHHFLGEVLKREDYWKKIQREIIDQYGDDDHKVTEMMLKKIGVDNSITSVILIKSFANSAELATSPNWYPRILLYSDMRVMPHGVTSFEERLKYFESRPAYHGNKSLFENLSNAARDIESQIQNNISVPVSKITDSLRGTNTEKFLNVNI